MNMKKLLSALLVLAMLLSILPMAAFAQSPVYYAEGHRTDSPRTRAATAGPTLASGNHQLYLDRVASWPDYALEYYRWLEKNTGITGVLVDPTLGTAYEGGGYYHQVTQCKGSKQFTFTSRDQIFTTANQIATEAMGDAFDSFTAYAGAVRDAFDRDHPEVFWLSGWTSHSYLGQWSYSVSGKTCTVTYQADMVSWLKKSDFDIRDTKYQDPFAVTTAMDIRDWGVEDILAECPDGSDYEKVVYLNDALTARNAYNSVVATGTTTGVDVDAWRCISALEGNCGPEGPVCEGYARAFQVLCNELQIPCVLVDGDAKSSLNEQPGGHMWNYVQIDGGWYAVDVTWDDPYVASKPNQKKSGSENRNWLLLGSNTTVSAGLSFLASHPVENQVRSNGLSFTNGPVLERSAYDPNTAPKYTISGKVTSFGTGTTTVQLWQGNDRKVSCTLSGNSAAYSLDGIGTGTYRLVVSKPGHVTRSQEIKVTNKSVTQDIKIHLVGDINGDGKISMADISRIYAHIRKTAVITDPYLQLCADATGEGQIAMADVSKLYSKVRNGQ